MIESMFDIISGELGVDFVRRADPSKRHRGILSTSKLLVEAYGSDVMAHETTLTTPTSLSLDVGEEIEIGKKDKFRIKNRSEDCNTRTVDYGLEKITS